MNFIASQAHSPWWAFAVVAAACFAATGCSGSASGSTERELVQGVIYCGRTPLKEGIVRFEPDKSNPSLATATGMIQSDGQFQLETETGRPVQPGRYRVIVTDGQGNMDGNIRSRSGDICLYGDTGQTAQVIAGAENQFRFHLPGPDGPRDMPEGQ